MSTVAPEDQLSKFQVPLEHLQLNRSKRRALNDALAGSQVNCKALTELICPTSTDKQQMKRTLDVDAAVDDFGNTLLHLAAQQLDANFVAILLLKGANPNAKNYAGVTPTRVALLMGSTEIQDLLTRHGASVELIWIPNDINVEMSFSYSGDNDVASRTKTGTDLAISSNFNPQYQNSYISNAAYVGLPQFEDLLSFMDPDTPDRYGSTSLMKAAYKNQVDIVYFLLNKGADAFGCLDSHGYNALIWACFGGSSDSLRLISQLDMQTTIQVINQQFGIGLELQITPLMAAVSSGSSKAVRQVVCLGADKGQQSCQLLPQQLATILGSAAILDELLTKSDANMPISELHASQWLVKGMAIMEGISLNSTSHPLAHTQNVQKAPYDMVAQIPDQLLEKNNLIDRKSGTVPETFSQDEKGFELVKTLLGARSRAFLTVDKASYNFTPTSTLQVLGIDLTTFEHKDVLVSLARLFHNIGTHLDVLHMTLVGEILKLMVAVGGNDKTQYIVIASKAIQEANELMRSIDSWLEKQLGNKDGKQSFSILNHTKMMSQMKDLIKAVKNDQLPDLLLVTKIAVGAWPPPDAVKNLMSSSLQLCRVSKRLVLMVNATGQWPLGVIEIYQFAVNKVVMPTSATESSSFGLNNSSSQKAKGLSFSDYQREAETKILQSIQTAQTQQLSKVQSQGSANSKPRKDPDEGFLQSVDNWVRQFVQSIQKLKLAKEQDLKTEFVSAASAAYTKVDGLIDEIRPYYLFKDLTKDFVVNRSKSSVSFKLQLRQYQETLLQLSDDIILKAKLAAGVWPPPNASVEMLQASFPVVAKVREMVNYVKEACVAVRQTESVERDKIEQFMNQWDQNQKVRDLFNQWEKLAKSAQKNDASLTAGQISAADKLLLADSDEGILIEKVNGKDIIKGGKLPKLVERLIDHNPPDEYYRNVFLFTYCLFTNALDLLALIVKRYEVCPPYDLDQRQFEIYVNQKVVPIRLRTLDVLTSWLQKYPEDFAKNKELALKCLDFVKEYIASDFENSAGNLIDLLKKFVGDEQVSQQQYIVDSTVADFSQKTTLMPKTLLAKNLIPSDIEKMLAKDAMAIVDIDTIEIARQITLVDFDIFKGIHCKECLDQGWEKKDKLVRSPHISQLIKNTNDLTYWVVTSIVTCRDMKQRVNLIKFFIILANSLFEIKNFNAVTAIVAAMAQGPVFRMTKTWSKFKKKNSKVFDLYTELSDSMSAKGQYARYRGLLKSSQLPILPFLGVFLTDLTFIDLGNPDFIPESNFIAFEKRRKIYNITEDLLKYQTVPFNFAEVSALSSYFKGLGKSGWISEKEFYEQSLTSEPREEVSDDDD